MPDAIKAIVCRRLGPPSVLRLEEVARPALAADQVRVRLHASAVNFPDLLMVAGGYQHKPPLPFVPGFEAAGEIIELGAEVADRALGDRVIVRLMTGGYAEEAVAPAASVLPLPANFSFVEGAAFPVAFGTAYVALVSRGRIARGDVLVVLGAAGGVGLAAVELGRLQGATVIAVVSSPAKAEAVRRAGAAHAILADAGDWAERVLQLTDGHGADLIYDPVGGNAFEQAIRGIAWGGRLLVVGFASGRLPSLAADRVQRAGCAVVGVRAGEFARRNPVQAAGNFRTLLRLAAAGQLTPTVYRVLPLSAAVEAIGLLVDRQVIGKVVLTI